MIQHTVAFRLIHPRGSEAEADFLAAGRRVADEATYAAYNDHPDHLHFVESRWLPEVAEFQEWDLVEVL